MPIAPGTKIGNDEIQAPLGEAARARSASGALKMKHSENVVIINIARPLSSRCDHHDLEVTSLRGGKRIVGWKCCQGPRGNVLSP